jgi:hypothetical protein
VHPESTSLCFSLYHPSFGEFLLTQDNSRNPYPLRPAAHYHAMIAESWRPFDTADWDRVTDRYAMLYLPWHLLEAGEVEVAARLLRSTFGERQSMLIGSAQTGADVEATARAAALSGRDELFFEMVAAAAGIDEAVKRQWESGQFALRLLRGGPAEILESTGYRDPSLGIECGAFALPWSGFLIAERLFDLEARDAARDVLREVARKPWPGYEPPHYSAANASEGSNLDFLPDTSGVGFLAKLARFDPDLALRLTRRLYPGEGKLPNARTAWREVIAGFLAWRSDDGMPASAEQARNLAATTYEWLKEGGYVLGWVGLTRGLFQLLARAVPAADPMWLANAFLLGTQSRWFARRAIQGAVEYREEEEDDRPGAWEAWADLLDAMTAIRNAIERDLPAEEPAQKAAVADSESTELPGASDENSGASGETSLDEALEEIVDKTIEGIPPMVVPDRPSYSSRVAYLAHLALSVYEAGSERWKEHAAAALSVCALDMTTDDPPRWAVVRALSFLSRIDDAPFHAQVEKAIDDLKLGGKVAGESAARLAALKPTPKPANLEQLAGDISAFEKGRVVLALSARGAASVSEIERALGGASPRLPKSRRGKADASAPVFSDLIAEALSAVLARRPGVWAAKALARLDASRSSGRRKRVTFKQSELQLAPIRALAAAKDWAAFRPQADKLRKQALRQRDYTTALVVCLLAIAGDADLADQWYTDLQKHLQKPADRGLAVVKMITELHQSMPDRLDELGRRWVGDLPAADAFASVSRYHLVLCDEWADIPLVRPEVIACLTVLSTLLPKAMERMRAKARDSEDGSSDDDQWKLAGDALAGAARLEIRAEDESGRAARDLVSVVVQELGSAASKEETWKVRAAARTILDQMAESEDSFRPGPAVDAAVQLFAIGEEPEERQVEPNTLALSDESRKRPLIVLGSGLAIPLKRASPDWSEERFNAAVELWQGMVNAPPRPRGMMDSMLQGLSDSLVSLGRPPESQFRNNREFELFNLTRQLADWCTADPPSPDRLARLQAHIAQIGDPDLRNLLLAPLAVAWLRFEDFIRIAQLAQLAGGGPLAKARFQEALRAYFWKLSGAPPELPIYKALALDLILLTPFQMYAEAFDAAVRSWVVLRSAEIASAEPASGAEDRYLQRITEWAMTASNQLARSH